LNLGYARLRAPFPGVVVKRYLHLGDFASPGVAILSMYNPDLTYVTANLEETELPGVAPGDPAELQVDAFGEPFRGRVVWIDKSTGAQFALMPRNVVSGEFTKVVQACRCASRSSKTSVGRCCEPGCRSERSLPTARATHNGPSRPPGR